MFCAADWLDPLARHTCTICLYVAVPALQVPELNPRVLVLLKRALYDNDDEVGSAAWQQPELAWHVPQQADVSRQQHTASLGASWSVVVVYRDWDTGLDVAGQEHQHLKVLRIQPNTLIAMQDYKVLGRDEYSPCVPVWCPFLCARDTPISHTCRASTACPALGFVPQA